MPDTGAPWNIPYVENADLVSDWPADSLLVANAVAAGLDAAVLPGIGSNVVQTVKTDTFTTTSTSFVAVTGMSVTITPTSATSKVFVIVQLAVGAAADNTFAITEMTRGGTSIYRGDAASNRVRAVFGGWDFPGGQKALYSQTIVYLDSPATTSATTYDVRTRSQTAGFTAFINRSGSDADSSASVRGASSITAIEVAP